MDITTHDLFLIGFLAFLEGILSIDNALVLALMAKHLPREQQRKALTYGLAGAIGFRLLSLAIVTQLMRWTWVKFAGGGYLVFIAVKHLFFAGKDEQKSPKSAPGFWKTVLLIELMDIAFAVDSILAAVALTNKFWIVFTGGFMGVVMMRFAASVFLKLLERFPRFETSAYLLILVIGTKLIVEGFRFPGIDFHSASQPAFWVFWSLMAAAFFYGFRRK
ncbi:MAG: TerC family protein [Oligoflexia bacterium]|nr:TerC family protein [Oligoflexia bacterium]